MPQQVITTKTPAARVRKYLFSREADSLFATLFDIKNFIAGFFREVFVPPFEWKEIISQCYNVGYRSLALISLTGFISGIVFTKQSRPSLANFGATSWLPSLIGIAVIRALAPLITALVVAGKVGSNIGAELGSMKVTEQIDAMEVSGTNPFKFLVVSRVLATTCMMPILVVYAAFIGLAGSYLNVHTNEQTSIVTFIEHAFSQLSFLDFSSALIRAIIFGFTIGIAGSYTGFNATQGTQGVGRAANTAVVMSMFLIFLEEMVIVQFVNFIRA
jgi:phospholipid/cholesterol/gamma-HCH transport system permease protein